MNANRRTKSRGLPERSPWELTERRPTRGKIASMKDYAAIEFKPLTRDKGLKPDELLPSWETMQNFASTARIAYGIMLRTKQQLMEGKLPKKVLEHLLNDLFAHAESLKSIAKMLEIAHARMISAGCAVEVAKDKARAAKRRRAA
jgi:hypothetical protein